MKPIHYSDHLERYVGEALEEKQIEFIHESQNNGSSLDFYLPQAEVYIEVKQYHSPRISEQLASRDEVIVLQGKKAVDTFIKMISHDN